MLFSYLESQGPVSTKHEEVRGFLSAVTGLALPQAHCMGFLWKLGIHNVDLGEECGVLPSPGF